MSIKIRINFLVGRHKVHRVIIIIAFLLVAQICSAATINVPGDSATIQAGIDAASEGDTVLVGYGTYTGEGNRDISFDGKSIVVMSVNGPDFTTLNLRGTESEPHRAFNFTNNETSSAELIGFTIKNGYGTFSHDHNEGGAMLIENSSPTIKNCVFANNGAGNQGGAVSCFTSEPTFINCTFAGNAADYGGGVYLNGSIVIMENCIIAFSSRGSAIYCSDDATVELSCCDLYGNPRGDWIDSFKYQLGINGNISENPLFCDTSATNYHIPPFSPCSPNLHPICGLVGALGIECYEDIEYPFTSQLTLDPILSGNIITTLEPEIIWTYFDTSSTTQSAYEIEVGTDDNWTTAEMWYSGTVNTSDQSTQYTGAPFTGNNAYFLRIRVNNGSEWGSWRQMSFWSHQNRSVLVPSEYPTIQAGIDVTIDGDTVLVAGGIYTGDGNRDISYNGKDIIVRSAHGPKFTTLDLQGSLSEPHRAFNFTNNETSSAELIGFTIKNGHGSGSHGGAGGAMLIEISSPTIKECVFVNNIGVWKGGAVSCRGSYSTFINCTFVANAASTGGAIYSNNGGLELENCLIAFSSLGWSIYDVMGGIEELSCCNFFGNDGGDWPDSFLDDLGTNGNISEDPLFCYAAAGNYHINSYSPCSPLVNYDCGLIGALDVDCGNDITSPLALLINLSPTYPGRIVSSPEPNIAWTYFDTIPTTQSAYEIEVGTDDDWTAAEMWYSGTVSSSDSNALYAGEPLTGNNEYFLRIRVNNGSDWGIWRQMSFWTHLKSTILVPSELPTIQAGINISLVGDTVIVDDGIYMGAGNRDMSFNGKNIVLISANGPEMTIIDCEGTITEPHRGFSFTNNEDSTSIISGFTIKSGFGPEESGQNRGGAIFCNQSSPLVVNCIFKNNNGDHEGGAVAAFKSPSIFRNCIFEANNSTYGGAVYFNAHKLRDGEEKSNDRSEGIPRIENCVFRNNSADPNDGYGGGILITNGLVNVIECVFYDNDANKGGGLSSLSLFVNITNCTFVRNKANIGSNIHLDGCSNGAITNTICTFGQTGAGLEGSPWEPPAISCCNFYGNEGGDWVDDFSGNLGVDGNISADPLFCDAANSDFHIQGYSPCGPYMNPECILIGAFAPTCNTVFEVPIAGNINYGPASNGHIVYQTDPEIFWSYIDTVATTQRKYRIEVGTDDDWTAAEMWSPGSVMSSDTSAVYAGLPLTPGETYFVRIRLNTDVIWGSWMEDWFEFSPSLVVKIPGLAPTIQEGIDMTSSGDTVLVAPGTYTGAGNRDLDFGGRNIVVISEEGPETTIINCEGSSSEPHRAFNFTTGENSYAILEGFTITGGWGQLVDDYYIGGAVYLDNTTPTINNCIFDQNIAHSGGAIYCYTASPAFNDCEFTTNSAYQQGGAVVSFSGEPIFNNCRFTGNNGGGKGGAIAGYDDISIMNGCTFDNNSAYDGGAVHFDGLTGKRSATVSMENCLLYENIGQSDGGAVYLGVNTAASILKCTFTDNRAPDGVGIFTRSSSLLNLENSIISNGVFGEAVYCDEPGTPNISCCNIWGNAGGDWTNCITGLDEINDNLSLDPIFCDAENSNYRLDLLSPCIGVYNDCGEMIGALGAGCEDFMCGDANNDGSVGVSDAVCIINFVFVGGGEPQPYLSGDTNCDATVNVSDAIWIINYVFVGGNDPCNTDGNGIPDC
jgi:Chlamydia polymorphic membrane protein (Chlamydia_PMP) repeat